MQRQILATERSLVVNRIIAFASFVLLLICSNFVFAQQAEPAPPPDFKGTMNLDVRDSKPDWGPLTPKAAPKGAPNVLVIHASV